MSSQSIERCWAGSIEACRHSIMGLGERVEWPQVV